jgi:hypothetical protein
MLLYSSMEDSIKFVIDHEEMIRMDSSGFYVKGRQVAPDTDEANQIYNAFKEFIVYHNLTKSY